MAIYLVKDSIDDSVEGVVPWSEEDQAKAGEILEECGFTPEEHGKYSDGKDTIFVGTDRITVPTHLRRAIPVLRIIADLHPAFYMSDLNPYLNYSCNLFTADKI